MYYCKTIPSPVGDITLAGDGKGLAGLWLAGQKYFGASIPGGMEEKSDLPLFDAAETWLRRYFAGEKPTPAELPLAPLGGEFRRQVWQILCEIPYGEVTTYGQIARQMATRLGRQSMSSQAVGGAVGHNPISIVIPCHRVVGANGNLTGYAGGVDKKIALLALEGADLSRFHIPKTGTAL